MLNKTLILFLLLFVKVQAEDLMFIGKFEQACLVIGIGEGIIFASLNDQELQIDNQSMFVLGFDKETFGRQLLKIKFKSGKVVIKRITLPVKKFKVQRINNMKQSLVTAPGSQNERIEKEREHTRLARQRIGEIDKAMYREGFVRPVKGGRVSGVFGSQRILNGVPKNIHNGLDIAAPHGTNVYAMTDGVVRLAADTFYYSGNNLLLDHGQGLNSFYLHLSKMFVEKGDTVKKGQKIGEIGTTGRSTGPHLHWGVQWFNKRIDPALLLELKL